MRKMILVRRFGLFCAGTLATIGCSSSNSQASIPEALTLIAIEPSDFVAAGACSTRLQSYVATLFDDTGPSGILDSGVSAGPFLIASSPAKACDQATVFANVVAGHAYAVELQGYSQPASDLKPAYISDITAGAGSSAMLLTADSSYAAPLWTAACSGWTDNAGNRQPGYCFQNMTVTLRDCTKLGVIPTQ